MHDELVDAINAQIAHELTSAYAYLGLTAYFEGENLPGFARWMRVQSGEEIEHAMKFFTFLADRDARIALKPLPAPPATVESPLDAFRLALHHEQRVTASIHELYALAVRQNDYPTQTLLHWFINEQVEEEKNAGDMVARLTLAGADAGALLMLDHEAGERGDEGE